MGDGFVRFQDKFQSFMEVLFGFPQSSSLSINSRNFFNKGKIPSALLHINGGKLPDHVSILTESTGFGHT